MFVLDLELITGINGSCPQQARDNSSYCNDGNNVCVDGVCSGSVCLKYNAVPCFCTETDDEEENQVMYEDVEQ